MEEGDTCTECKKGVMDIHTEDCSCHINPPCASCTEGRLICNNSNCGHIYRPPEEI